jgi:hypothetical protein
VINSTIQKGERKEAPVVVFTSHTIGRKFMCCGHEAEAQLLTYFLYTVVALDDARAIIFLGLYKYTLF